MLNIIPTPLLIIFMTSYCSIMVLIFMEINLQAILKKIVVLLFPTYNLRSEYFYTPTVWCGDIKLYPCPYNRQAHIWFLLNNLSSPL